MDPNAALTDLRQEILSVKEALDGRKDRNLAFHARELVSLVELLDTWMSRKGFLPHDWRDPTPPNLGIALSRGQVESWVGFRLTDEQIEQIEDCLPQSSIPEAIQVIATDALGISGISTEGEGDL